MRVLTSGRAEGQGPAWFSADRLSDTCGYSSKPLRESGKGVRNVSYMYLLPSYF